jgi:hypothetical protein
MREVIGVDDAGHKLLVAMRDAGAGFVAQGVAMTALIDEISGKQPSNGTKQQRRRTNLAEDRDSKIRRVSK